ncbi:MAG TPA: DUF4339 domain-containing protein, partial [Polyangiaceae bacterium]
MPGFVMNDYQLTNDGQLDSEDETLRAGNHKSSGTHSNEWLVNVADDVVVPMVTSEVVEALRTGRLTNRSLVWRTGMHDWSALAEVPQLRLAAGPSALPSAASTPGPIIVNKPPKPTAEQRRRNTLPMGFPAVRDAASVQQPAGLSAALSTPVSTPRAEKPKREDSSDALAVYERPAPSLTFSDSVRAEWQGKGRIVNRGAASPAPAAHSASPAPRRLTPVPVVPTRLPARIARSLPSNTLAPTTAEAETAASTRGLGMWGDRSVVLASELRAVKRTSKRVALWAAVGSALIASGLTVWAVHAPLPGFAQGLLPSFAQTPSSPPPPVAAAAHEAAPSSLEPTANTAAATNIAAPAATVVASAPPVVAATSIPLAVKPAVVMQPRAVKRAKPPAPESTATGTPAAAEFNPYADGAAADAKPSDAKPSDAKPSDAKPSDA